MVFASKPEELLINLKSLHAQGSFFRNYECKLYMYNLRRSTFKSNKKYRDQHLGCTLHSCFLKINSLLQQFASCIVAVASSKDDQKMNAYLNRKLQIVL